MRRFLGFWLAMIRYTLRGSATYYRWMGGLLVLIALGVYSYVHHVQEGLVITNMSDDVSWGMGIACFVYFVGVAAAAAILVVPAYAYGRKDIKKVVIIGELLAVVAVVMCLLFIMTDVGRPERLWHLFPPMGILNLPSSMLAWDVLVFNGYLLLNLHIPGYLLYAKYRGLRPKAIYYLPPVFISMFWAVSIHTVTAFLLSGLGSRPHWNTALLAPRFLISAGASGPALLLIIFAVVRRYTRLEVQDSVMEFLKQVLRVTMPINLFLLGCEFFQEFYSGSLHSVGARYLYFGIGEHDLLPKLIWPAIAMNVVATVIFLGKGMRDRPGLLYAACGLTIVGIWIEKGVGLIFPGFTPSPLGEVVAYTPNLSEATLIVGILALGAFVFTAMARVAIAVDVGDLRLSESARTVSRPSPTEPRSAPT